MSLKPFGSAVPALSYFFGSAFEPWHPNWRSKERDGLWHAAPVYFTPHTWEPSMAYVKLIDLVRKFDSGVVELPLMQRDYVWPPSKVVKLLDSLYRRWPIGVFYIWRTPNRQAQREAAIHRKVGAKITEPFWGYLLDGQQRLTSLSRALDDKFGDNLATRAFFDIRKCEFVMGNRTKTIEKRIANDDPTLVDLCRVIPKSPLSPLEREGTFADIINKLVAKGVIKDRTRDVAEYRYRLTQVADMLEATSPCEDFQTGDSDEDLENAIELFKRLNKGGKTLSRGDAEAASLTHRATANIVPKMRTFVQSNHQRRLGLNFVFATRALITAHRDSATFSDLPKNWALGEKDINESWTAAERGLNYVIAFVREELGWSTRRWLPSANALIPLAYLLRDRDSGFAANEREDVRRYLSITGVRGLFRGSVESTINAFISPIRKADSKAKRRAALIFKRIPKDRLRPIKSEDILKERGMYSPLMQVYLAYLVSKGVRTWFEEAPLLDVAMREINDPLAVHHIFPRNLLREHRIEPDRINCMANYAILSQADNANIGDCDPTMVYAGLKGKAKDYSDEQLFYILTEKRDWIEAYDAFLQKRADALADRLNSFLRLG